MKDKLTIKQAMDEINKAYDHFEKIAKETLRKEFGFGPKRIARFEEVFSELSAMECIRIKDDLRKKVRK